MRKIKSVLAPDHGRHIPPWGLHRMGVTTCSHPMVGEEDTAAKQAPSALPSPCAPQGTVIPKQRGTGVPAVAEVMHKDLAMAVSIPVTSVTLLFCVKIILHYIKSYRKFTSLLLGF